MKLQKKLKFQYIHTTEEVGQRTGLSPISLRAYLRRYKLGEKKDDRWRYSEADIEIILAHMRRGPGRPKKEQA